jgi:hypothetical protein
MLLPVADLLPPAACDVARGIVSDPTGDVSIADWRPHPGDASIGCRTGDVAGADSKADMGACALAIAGSCGSNSEVDPVP